MSGEDDIRRRLYEAPEFEAPEAPEIPEGATQVEQLILLAGAADLFHDADREGYAEIPLGGHRETWPVMSRGFEQWLQWRFHQVLGGAPAREPLRRAIDQIKATAAFASPQRAVFTRIAAVDGAIYLDLADAACRVLRIDHWGWRIDPSPPVRFRRARGLRPLPDPVRGGSIELLRPYLNVASDDDFILAVSWLLAALRGVGPYPLLVLSGEQGTAKSSFTRLLRGLVDPSLAPLRTLPASARDLFVSAKNSHVQAFDNVSHLSPGLSDNLCGLATGSGFSVRKLFSDDEETIIDAARPIIINGIGAVVTRPDLADRALLLRLEPIAEASRLAERKLAAELEPLLPEIFGALLDGVVTGLRRLSGVELAAAPRMADFAEWATACETAFWPEGAFMAAYAANRDRLIEETLEADPVACALLALLINSPAWSGTATELLGKLAAHAPDVTRRSRSWPKTAATLSMRLVRLKTFLRQRGVEVERDRVGHGGERMLHLSREVERTFQSPGTSSAASASSAGGLADDADDTDDDFERVRRNWSIDL